MSSAQNRIQKSMENIQATETMKQNTLRYLEAQRTGQSAWCFWQKPNAALRYAMAVSASFCWLGQVGIPCIAVLYPTSALM